MLILFHDSLREEIIPAFSPDLLSAYTSHKAFFIMKIIGSFMRVKAHTAKPQLTIETYDGGKTYNFTNKAAVTVLDTFTNSSGLASCTYHGSDYLYYFDNNKNVWNNKIPDLDGLNITDIDVQGDKNVYLLTFLSP